MNAIDRDEAIRLIASYPGPVDKSVVRRLLMQMPEAGRWIPVTERLPEEKTNPNTLDFEQVLCSTTFGDVRAYSFGTPMGYSEPHFLNGPGFVDKYVVAWMPLPKPYEGGEQDATD